VITLLYTFGYGQKAISIEYTTKIVKEEGFDENMYFRKAINRAIEESRNLSFFLICKKNQSYFYSKNLMYSDNLNVANTTLLFAGYTGHVYQMGDTILHKSDILGKNIYGIQYSKKDWALTKETKTIDGYVCFKATSVNRITYKDKVFNHPVIAWYCPEIPYYFGPNGYSGLPGLILELTVRNVTFFAQKINFRSEEDFEINTSKMKILDEVALDKAFDKLNDF
jgi:GLPGLI family protein